MATRIQPIDDENAFRAWLSVYHHHNERLIGNTIARCRRINRDLGNVRMAYDYDRCKQMLSTLTYTIEDAHDHRQAPGNLVSKGEKDRDAFYVKTLREGLAALRKELEVYCQYRGSGQMKERKTVVYVCGRGENAIKNLRGDGLLLFGCGYGDPGRSGMVEAFGVGQQGSHPYQLANDMPYRFACYWCGGSKFSKMVGDLISEGCRSIVVDFGIGTDHFRTSCLEELRMIDNIIVVNS